MGFIEQTGSTIEVKATLTDYGRSKLFRAIKGESAPQPTLPPGADLAEIMRITSQFPSTNFITRFCLGDSDCNYNISAGQNAPLLAGHVPDVDVNDPRLKSSAVWRGDYPGGQQRMYINGLYTKNITYNLNVDYPGSNIQQMTFLLKTKWGRKDYDEDYDIIVNGYNRYVSYRVPLPTNPTLSDITRYTTNTLMGENWDMSDISRYTQQSGRPIFWSLSPYSSSGTRTLTVGVQLGYIDLSFISMMVQNDNSIEVPFEIIGKKTRMSKMLNVVILFNRD